MSRALALLLAATLAPVPQAPPPSSPPEDRALADGIALVKEGDFEAAVIQLDAAARALASRPDRARDLARADAYLAVAYIELNQETLARSRFRAALEADPDLLLSPREFSPQSIRVFESVREAMVPRPAPAATPAPVAAASPAGLRAPRHRSRGEAEAARRGALDPGRRSGRGRRGRRAGQRQGIGRDHHAALRGRDHDDARAHDHVAGNHDAGAHDHDAGADHDHDPADHPADDRGPCASAPGRRVHDVQRQPGVASRSLSRAEPGFCDLTADPACAWTAPRRLKRRAGPPKKALDIRRRTPPILNGNSFITAMARRRSDDKRRRILDAAVKVFAKKGYFAARVSEIAKKADVADGTIYLYFKGKEDILVSLFDEIMSEYVAEARRAIEEVEGAPERLRVLAEHHLAGLGGDRDLAVVFQVELRQSTQFIERFTAGWLKEYLDLVGAVIEEGQKDGSLRSDLPRKLVTKAFFGMLDEMVTSWMVGGRDYDLAALAGPVVDLLLRGVSASGASAAARRPLAAATGRGGR